MAILVLGSTGMLGRDLVSLLIDKKGEKDILAWGRKELDITEERSVKESFFNLSKKQDIDVVINCAAYTGVDKAEEERELAYKINAIGAKNVARASRIIGAKTVYFSTDYVFDGEKAEPYIEDDETNPINYYGYTKLIGEQFTSQENPDSLIIRTQWLYGIWGSNFVETMIHISKEKDEIKVVDDQRGSPTYTFDLSYAVIKLLEKECCGIYHVSNSGDTTWFGFAREIFRLTEREVLLVPTSSETYRSFAKRPKNSVFSMEKLKNDTGHIMRVWREGLQNYLKSREY